MTRGRLLDGLNLRGEVVLHVADGPVDIGIDFNVALHELGLDRPAQVGRDLRHDGSDGTFQGHRRLVDQLQLDFDAQGGPGIAVKGFMSTHQLSLLTSQAAEMHSDRTLGDRAWVRGADPPIWLPG